VRAPLGFQDGLALLAGQPSFRWLLAVAVVALGTTALVIVKPLLLRRLTRLSARTENRVDDLLVDMVGRTSWLFLVALSTLAATALLTLPAAAERFLRGAALVICLVQGGIWGSRALREVVERRFATVSGDDADPSRRTVGRMLALAARVGLWALVLLVALDNLGVNITALVAGLGVGGVAVALATQNILGDLFASVSILLDKPFVPGDFVVVGDFMGTVEQIGIKTTRVRSLGGEQIVFANNDLLQSRLRNYKRMDERRALFRVGVTYQTPVEKVVAIPEMLRTIVQNQLGTRFDRAHFASYGDFALTFEVVYYVLSPDYNRFMDVQQAINLDIFRSFHGQDIEFAYPTQTLLLQPPHAAGKETQP
jgi:small-conductance mechanosensitive channel